MPIEYPRWRKNSIFGPGPRVPLCRERKAQYRAKLHLQRQPGRLTIAAAQIGRVLADMVGRDGQLDPSHATIARRAAVAVSTVKRALEQLRDFGFVTWTRRLVRTSPGWRTEQTSNAYVLLIPCEAHSAREAIFHRFKKGAATAATATSCLPTPTHEAREAAVAALERRRAVIEGRIRIPTAGQGSEVDICIG